eukprot:5467416-Amphidinium_carterae.1
MACPPSAEPSLPKQDEAALFGCGVLLAKSSVSKSSAGYTRDGASSSRCRLGHACVDCASLTGA